MMAEADRSGGARTWKSLTMLVAHIVIVHHAYAREAMLRIRPLAASTLLTHGSMHPELARVVELFDDLCDELDPHMRSEEGTLFPAILEMAGEDCLPERREALRVSMRVMEHDHHVLSRIQQELREITSSYTPPADADASLHALYKDLEALDHNLDEHVHLENDVLLPGVRLACS